MAGIYQAKGDLDRALPLFKRALKIVETAFGKEHPEVALVLNGLAGLYRAKGELKRALPLYQRAMEIVGETLGKEHPDLAITLSNLGGLYVAEGTYDRALPLYNRALKIKEKSLGGDHIEVAKTLTDLAGLYTTKGDYDRALPLYKRILAIQWKTLGADHPEVAVTLNNLGGLCEEKGEVDQALGFFLRAYTILEGHHGEGHPAVATTLNNLAGLHRTKGEYDRALTLYNRALKIKEKALGKDHPGVAITLNNLARVYFDKGELARALSLYERTLTIKEKALGKDHFSVATPLNNLATIRWAMDRPRDALMDLRRGMDIQNAYIAQNLGRGIAKEHRLFVGQFEHTRHMLVTLLLALGDDHEEARLYGAEAVLATKARATGASVRISRNTRRQMALFELVQKTQSELEALTYRANSDPDKIETLKTRLQRLQRQMAGVGQQSEADTKMSVAALKRLLGEKEALVEWVVYRPYDPKGQSTAVRYGEAHLAAVVIRSGQVPRWFYLGPLETISPAVKRLNQAIAGRRTGLKEAAAAVTARVIAPLEPALDGIEKLIVSPDGPLHQVSFAALVDGKDRWLAERFQLRGVTTGRDLFVAADSVFESRQAPLILADPQFDRRASEKKGGQAVAQADVGGSRGQAMAALIGTRLPGTEKEANALRELLGLGVARTRLGAQASESSLKALKGPKILHIATHGFFLPGEEGGEGDDAMLRSGLMLAGFNHREDAPPQDDGVLTALGVAGLDLYGTDLVVLSACETGLGKVDAGEGVYGLKRALVLAGSRTQIVSLWKVDDDATQALMTAYYGRLLKGEDRIEALRQVQLDMAQGRLTKSGLSSGDRGAVRLGSKPDGADVSGWRHPYYWAAFTVSGADGPIALK